MKHSIKLWILSLCLIPLNSTWSTAEDKSSGCGLGWQVTKSNTLFATTTRGYTNVTGGSTFAMTSGTSGCDKHPLVKNEVPAYYFAMTNSDSLLQEIAQGKGEYLDSFAVAFGCSQNVMSRFRSNAQNQMNFNDLELNDSQGLGWSLFQKMRAVIKHDAVLNRACGGMPS